MNCTTTNAVNLQSAHRSVVGRGPGECLKQHARVACSMIRTVDLVPAIAQDVPSNRQAQGPARAIRVRQVLSTTLHTHAI